MFWALRTRASLFCSIERRIESSCPVMGLSLKKGSLHARWAKTAARFPPAEIPPTRKPLDRLAETSSGWAANCEHQAKESLTGPGNGLSGASLIDNRHPPLYRYYSQPRVIPFNVSNHPTYKKTLKLVKGERT
ncbi:alpha beta hydrolase fold-3 domain-containing protein [Moniliophthora roreri]|nr:alpha beta hydrolase fold-3 domain-containing protein [Moniliophthora roreri]